MYAAVGGIGLGRELILDETALPAWWVYSGGTLSALMVLFIVAAIVYAYLSDVKERALQPDDTDD